SSRKYARYCSRSGAAASALEVITTTYPGQTSRRVRTDRAGEKKFARPGRAAYYRRALRGAPRTGVRRGPQRRVALHQPDERPTPLWPIQTDTAGGENAPGRVRLSRGNRDG